jgi:hypothetical protein
MAWKPGESGNPKGRPPLAPEMNDALRLSAARLLETMPNAHLTAHGLLSAVYRNDEYPLALRLRCAEAALPYEKPRLSATAVLETGNESLAARLRAAQIRVGVRAADVIALARDEQDKADAADATLTAPFTVEGVSEAAGVPPLLEGQAEAVTIAAPIGRTEDYI